MKNNYKVLNDRTVIFINYKGGLLECYIDTEDLPLVNSFYTTWTAERPPIKQHEKSPIYVITRITENNKTKKTILHRLILKTNELIDHINGNGLDNRKENLRIVTRSQNQHNRHTPVNNSSGVRGVYKIKDGYYKAQIMLNRKNYFLGHFRNLEDAANSVENFRKENGIWNA